jgi:NADPH-dependent 2,4-dienoyl-CoA reductase/sulfur reductase-like enzyme
MRELFCSVAVFGGGPAGIAAAVTASRAGLSTVLVDDGLAPGGQIWRGASATTGGDAGRWLRALAGSPAEVWMRTRLVAHPEPGMAILESPEGPVCLRYLRAVVCAGARELFLPFPGWTLPGVSGAGGLQALVKGGLPISGKRVVVAGSGPLLLAVAAALEQKGAEIVFLAEQAEHARLRRFAAGLWRHPGKAIQALALARQAWRLQADSWVVRAEGGASLERVVVRRGGREVSVACDHLACGFGLVPNSELPALLGCRIEGGRAVVDDWLRSSQQDVLCAGEVNGIGGVDAALIEGRIAGHVAANQMAEAALLRPRRVSIRRFAALAEDCFALRPELKALAPPEVLLCRCEDVSAGAVAACHSWREARLLTRCGMGACQGRVCGAAAGFLHGWSSTTARPPLQPTSLHHLRLPGTGIPTETSP